MSSRKPPTDVNFLGEKRGPQPRLRGTATHVSGGRGVRVQREGSFEWERVNARGTMLKDGQVATSPQGSDATLRGPDGRQVLPPGSLAKVSSTTEKPKPARKLGWKPKPKK